MNNPDREYMNRGPRTATIMPSDVREGVPGFFKVFDAEEDLVAVIYASDASEDALNVAYARAKKLVKIIDGETP